MSGNPAGERIADQWMLQKELERRAEREQQAARPAGQFAMAEVVLA